MMSLSSTASRKSSASFESSHPLAAVAAVPNSSILDPNAIGMDMRLVATGPPDPVTGLYTVTMASVIRACEEHHLPVFFATLTPAPELPHNICGFEVSAAGRGSAMAHCAPCICMSAVAIVTAAVIYARFLSVGSFFSSIVPAFRQSVCCINVSRSAKICTRIYCRQCPGSGRVRYLGRANCTQTKAVSPLPPPPLRLQFKITYLSQARLKLHSLADAEHTMRVFNSMTNTLPVLRQLWQATVKSNTLMLRPEPLFFQVAHYKDTPPVGIVYAFNYPCYLDDGSGERVRCAAWGIAARTGVAGQGEGIAEALPGVLPSQQRCDVGLLSCESRTVAQHLYGGALLRCWPACRLQARLCVLA